MYSQAKIVPANPHLRPFGARTQRGPRGRRVLEGPVTQRMLIEAFRKVLRARQVALGRVVGADEGVR